MKRSLGVVAALLLAACGAEDSSPLGAAGQAEGGLQSATAGAAAHPLIEPLVLAVAQGPGVQVTDIPAPDGTRATVLVGIMGCGFWELGRAEATVRDGAVRVSIDADEKNFQWAELYVLIDDDGNGACTEGADRLFNVSEPTRAPGSLSASLTGVPPGGYIGCWLFGRATP